MIPNPSVGRVVHYVSEGSPVLPDGSQKYRSVCRAAIVTAVPDVSVPEDAPASLCVLNPTGFFFREDVPRDELPPPDRICLGERATHRPGSWHWPERV